MKKILVFLSDIDISDQALFAAWQVANSQNAEMTLLRVIDFNTDIAQNAITRNERLAYSDEATTTLNELSELRNQLIARGIKTTSRLCHGQAVNNILEMAHAQSSDLIVMANTASDRTSQFKERDIATELCERALCPILLISRPEAQFRKVLFPILQLEGAMEKYFFGLPIINKGRVLVNLVAFPSSSGSDSRDSLVMLLAQMEERLFHDGVQFRSSACISHSASRSILNLADKEFFDVIIVTDSTSNGIRDLAFVDYANEIINNSKTNVFFVNSRTVLKRQLIDN